MAENIRKPAVAGTFYAGSPQSLDREVATYLKNVPDSVFQPSRLFGIISPHAGYSCSAPTAAYGFRLMYKFPVKTVIVIAPSHSDYFQGVSIFHGEGYETPLGVVPVDVDLCQRLKSNSKNAILSAVGHQSEHSLEVQLPFLQKIYPDGFNLVPITVGVTTAEDLREFAEALFNTTAGEQVMVVASSDLSHYYPHEIACRKDAHFIKLLEDYDLESLGQGYDDQSLEACGLGPILVLMHYADHSGQAKCKSLDYRTSGDTCSSKSQVVGYVSAVVYE
ncbi:MAG TPA: AmmeMemoRadiSam system protein B [Candidatus Marinimicrobia bacterium]|nr:AmmeMemoRadiSam system protein B [Candidatus Neomarinimicrobiota bacterium]